jgi:predicted transcriptional regulator of viral defense system
MNRLTYNGVVNKLLKSNISVFTVNDFSKIFNVEGEKAGLFLNRYSKKDETSIKRVKRGLYVFSLNPPIKYEVANILHKPSYISFESALSYYKIIPETVYSVTSATTRRSASFDVDNLNYQFRKLKKKLFFGYRPVIIQGKLILMAEKEKALLDYIYISNLNKAMPNERMDLKKIDKDRLGYYINFFRNNLTKNKAFIKLVKQIFKKHDIKTIY